jgi:SAM-dependent methyltransferase
MIEAARAAHRRVPGLAFYLVDVYALPFRGEFDIVATARVLQWLADPEAALRGMMKGLRRGGRIVVLDYNHRKASWTPEPPASMRRFVEAFLQWRAAAGLDNAIADRLEKLLAAAGLTAVTSTDQSEITRRGDPDFEMRADGAISESARRDAEIEYRAWLGEAAQSHAQYLRAAEGVRP